MSSYRLDCVERQLSQKADDWQIDDLQSKNIMLYREIETIKDRLTFLENSILYLRERILVLETQSQKGE